MRSGHRFRHAFSLEYEDERSGNFEPLPLFAGVIVAGVVRSLRTARQRG